MNKSEKIPAFFILLSLACIIILLVLKYKYVLHDVCLNQNYKFFDNDPFWFGLLTGIFGGIIIVSVYYWIKNKITHKR
jgi:hypothetical protein